MESVDFKDFTLWLGGRVAAKNSYNFDRDSLAPWLKPLSLLITPIKFEIFRYYLDKIIMATLPRSKLLKILFAAMLPRSKNFEIAIPQKMPIKKQKEKDEKIIKFG